MTSTPLQPEPRRGERDAPKGPQPSPAELAHIQSLYDRGRLYEAYRATVHLAPLRQWRDPEARVLGGRLAHHLGAPKLADGLMLLAWRRSPENVQARYFGIHALLSRRGPVEALDAIDRYPTPQDNATIHAEWLALKGQVLGLFRDFARAEALLREAREVAPDHHWIALEAAGLLGMQDRLPEALEEARRGFALQPLHPGSTTAQAQILTLLGRNEEAISVLQAAMQTLQASTVAAFLATLLTEEERYEEALAAWEACHVLMPLIDADSTKSIYVHLSHLQYLLGNLAESRRLAAASGDRFLQELAARPDETTAARPRRVKLAVPFIKQHHVTCVPTTMAMLGRYWNSDLEHLAIAEQITYGGTASHRERRWAEEHGWIVREFTVTWEATVALIDRGVPFTLTTTSGDSGHEQAVAGYDTHRRTILVRDPSVPLHVEIDVKALLESERSGGPRGMVMLPSAEAARLDGVELPEAAERDTLHAMALALDRYDRAGAERLCAELPPGRISHRGQQMVASFDHDMARLLRVTDDELVAYPGDTRLLLTKQSCLADLYRKNERVALLRELIAARPPSHPIFRRIYAGVLCDTAEGRDDAREEIRRYLRYAGADPEGLRVLANITWTEQAFDTATVYYRLAASAGETNESLASAYFIAASQRSRPEEGLEYLRDRARRASARSSLPARTLFWALTQHFRAEEAMNVLQEAMALRPDDGELLLYAADAFARYSRAEADDLLGRAEPLSRRRDFLATRAKIASYRGQLQKSLADWTEAYELQPISSDAHEAITELLEQTSGRRAAIDFLESLIERFPEHRMARAILARKTRDVDPALHEQVVRRFLDVAPGDAWALRELADCHARAGRFDEAIATVAQAEEIEPSNSAGPAVLGRVLLLANRPEDARTALLRALEIYADDGYALTYLGNTAANARERQQLYISVFDTVLARSSYGEGVLTWYGAAQSIPPEQLLELTRTAVARRPESWQCHSILIRQLVRMGLADEAVERAEAAVRRFPLQADLLLDAAAAHRARRDSAKEAEAMEGALRIDAHNATAAMQLARLLDVRGERDRAFSVLAAASAANPLEANVQRVFGNMQWERGEKEEALERLTRAAALDPDDDDAWQDLARCASAAGQADLPLTTALKLVEEKPGSATSWLALAAQESDPSARLSAIERAIAADPHLQAAYDQKAVTLAENERFVDALAVCTSVQVNGRTPLSLRGREAWIHARRGDLKTAIARMNAVIADEPNYGWGWYQLCLWHRAEGENELYLRAATELTRTNPDSALSWNYLAEAELWSKHGDRAEAALRRALHIERDNTYAAVTLADILLDNNDVKGAVKVLDATDPDSRRPAFKLRRIRIAVRRKLREPASRFLRELIADEALDGELVHDAIEVMKTAWHAEDLRKALEEQAGKGTFHPEAAAEFVLVLIERNKAVNALDLIAVLQQRKPGLGRPAAIAFLEKAASTKSTRLVDQFKQRFSLWWANDIEIWGMLSYALTSTRQYEMCLSDTKDWASRRGVRPFMLLNVSLAYRHTGRDAEAAKVNEYALACDPDHATDLHRIWQAYDRAMAGRTDLAETSIGPMKLDGLNIFYQHIARMTWALIMAQRESAGNWKRAATAQLRIIVQARTTSPLAPLTRTCYKRTVRKLRERFGRGWWDGIWAWHMETRV